MVQQNIRNFCIIAHIDHGKSTLADRMLQMTGTVSEREMKEQVLDSMDLERERGITIKASAVRLEYPAENGQMYILNLIDTPGHVDFSYEVSRSLAACEGAILVVDAAQGVEAQTVANVYLAVDHGLEIIPVINKIDLPAADPGRVLSEVEDLIGIDGSRALSCSAKEGTGVREILEAVVRNIPPPSGEETAPLRALIFDSAFDTYRGVVTYVRVREGILRPGMMIRLMSNGREFQVDEVGIFRPTMTPTETLEPGEVGYVIAGIKDVHDMRIGDTVTEVDNPAGEPLAVYREPKPMVFCGLYPTEGADFTQLRDALEKLRLNDASLTFQPESSVALGFGFRCGFLGLLHMDIVQERLEREYEVNLIATAPSVVYRVTSTAGTVVDIDNPTKLPSANEIEKVEEPMVDVTILVPETYVGPCMELCESRRGTYKRMDYTHTQRVSLAYKLPLSEILLDFFDQLKSRSKGYASLDYELAGFHEAKLVRVDLLVNGEGVDALSFIAPREFAHKRGKDIAVKLKEILPRQMFQVRIQAAIGNKIVASESLSAKRKDVIAKCYGGDITRKRKLLEKQKEGKKRMKMVGSVEIPQEAFMSVLKVGD
ncbi:MAG: elongation factor 4 [Armatimonadetes bacterium]|nr:elongation factor 4 [Armatimonadota bacterium]